MTRQVDAIPQHVEDVVAEEVLRQATARPFYGQDPKRTEQEVRDATHRALAVGARPPLTFAGMGMTGTVLCDARGHAYKAARTYGGRLSLEASTVLPDEAEWLETASNVPGVREHVAAYFGYYPEVGVLERECVQETDEPRGAYAVDLFEQHEQIKRQMLEHGWSAPEYKPDSYVETKDRGHVLVDAGFAQRHKRRLVDYVEDVLAGRRPWRDDSPEDLAWALRWDFREPRPSRVDELLVELEREHDRRRRR